MSSRSPLRMLWGVAVGIGAALAGSVAWAALMQENLQHMPARPWAAAAMAAILGLWWLYFVRGRGWPADTGDARRSSARANAVREELWAPALGTGVLGLATIVLLQGVLARMLVLPRQQDIDPSRYPVPTVFAWVVMSALVAGVVEETSFRGYVQRSIETRYGPVAAILGTGVVFAFAHFSHPEVGLVLLPYYVAVAAVYGGLAYATDSTLPSMVLHTGGNLLSAFSLFAGGRSEWQGVQAPQPSIWQSGLDAGFVVSVAVLCLFGAATVWAYHSLVRAAKASPRGVLRADP